MTRQTQPVTVYHLNDRDEIIFVSDDWGRSAGPNDAQELAFEKIKGRRLWDFVTDATTRQLYRDAIAAVRAGREVRFGLRCDSHSHRRGMEMTISLVGPGRVEFRVSTLWVEDRDPVALLDPAVKRSGELLRACGWCKRFHIEGEWIEVEEAVSRLHLFDEPVLPNMTHGICDDCLVRLTKACRS